MLPPLAVMDLLLAMVKVPVALSAALAAPEMLMF